MDHVLALREYQRASIGDRWDPKTRTVSREIAARIEALQAGQAAEFLSLGRRSLQAQEYVGTVGLGDCAIELLPKVDEPENASVRAQLVSMLSVAGIVPHLEAGEAGVAQRQATLLDAYLAIYVRRLAAEWRRGPIRDYQREDRRREYLRGKLLIARQIRESLRYSLVFDMNVVFERYVGRLLARVCTAHGLVARLQGEERSLLVSEGRERFRLRPDAAVYERERLLCLIDTKWKRLDPDQSNWGISQADMYQMYAYGKEYSCPRVVLVYPRFRDLPFDVATYRHHPGDPVSPGIEVRCIEVGAGDAPAARDLERIVS